LASQLLLPRLHTTSRRTVLIGLEYNTRTDRQTDTWLLYYVFILIISWVNYI
jgi:hypothetical protein